MFADDPKEFANSDDARAVRRPLAFLRGLVLAGRRRDLMTQRQARRFAGLSPRWCSRFSKRKGFIRREHYPREAAYGPPSCVLSFSAHVSRDARYRDQPRRL
jgi:hypothetical protein